MYHLIAAEFENGDIQYAVRTESAAKYESRTRSAVKTNVTANRNKAVFSGVPFIVFEVEAFEDEAEAVKAQNILMAYDAARGKLLNHHEGRLSARRS